MWIIIRLKIHNVNYRKTKDPEYKVNYYKAMVPECE